MKMVGVRNRFWLWAPLARIRVNRELKLLLHQSYILWLNWHIIKIKPWICCSSQSEQNVRLRNHTLDSRDLVTSHVTFCLVTSWLSFALMNSVVVASCWFISSSSSGIASIPDALFSFFWMRRRNRRKPLMKSEIPATKNDKS